MARSEVLRERVPGRDNAQRSDRLHPPHWPQPGFEPAVICFHSVIRILLEDVSRGRDELLDHAWVDRCPVGSDLSRRRSRRERTGEECPGRSAVTAFADQDIDDLPVPVDPAVEIAPAPGDLDVGFVDEPPVTGPRAVPGGRRR